MLRFYGVFILFGWFFFKRSKRTDLLKDNSESPQYYSSISILCKTLLIVDSTKSAVMCHEKWCSKENARDHRSKFSNLSNWKEEARKNQGFNGIRTHDLRDTDAMLYQLSYEATHWEQGQFIPSREVKSCEIYI